MGVPAVGNELSTGTQASSVAGLESMKAEDFFRLLITQLQFQDPLEPVSNDQMVAQIAQIRDMEASMTMTKTLKSLANQQQLSGVSGLIGKFVQAVVTGLDGNPTLVEGTVTAVHFTSTGDAILELDTGQMARVENVTAVTDSPGTDQADGSDEADGLLGDLDGDGDVDEEDLTILEQIVYGGDDSEASS